MKVRPLARPNHQFEKRRRELAKQQKKEEKRLRKLEKGPEDGDVDTLVADGEGVEDSTEAAESTEEAETPDSSNA